MTIDLLGDQAILNLLKLPFHPFLYHLVTISGFYRSNYPLALVHKPSVTVPYPSVKSGWSYGFKLHLTINNRGELLNILLASCNVEDRKSVPKLVQQMFGKIYGDQGYIPKELSAPLLQIFGMQLVTKLKANAKNRLPMVFSDNLLRDIRMAQ